jgi:diguanylate cyclase (GGDEF)-like protein
MPIEMERARRYKRVLSVSVCDIDYFKKVNDAYGHSAGDYVLKTVAELIKANLRKTSYLFRMGGEEFLILAPETDLEGACIMAERMRKVIEDYRFEVVGTVTASFGVAQLIDDDTMHS